MMMQWSAAQIGEQTGKLAVITGGNSGIGYETALALARAKARVLIACRDARRGAHAIGRIRRSVPGASVELVHLDLASLSSIQECAAGILSRTDRIDMLVNNAGVMAIPDRHTTADGFEMQFGTNHLGHFALTGRLLPALLAAPWARVVTVSSILHRGGRVDFADLQRERSYTPRGAYAQSKLANLMFAHELQRRAAEAPGRLASIAVHPGWSATSLQSTGPRLGRMTVEGWLGETLTQTLAQSAAMGALPTLFAATSADAEPGGFYGPDGWGELRGHPAPARPAPQALDREAWTRLWETSEHLTGVSFRACR